MSYAGDVSCDECWKILAENSEAQLIDVRTKPEWNFVGIPELGALGKEAKLIEWQQFPTMEVNSSFVEAVSAGLGVENNATDRPVFLLCRSGVRSIAAAQALTASGYTSAYNILAGFEGDLDENYHRANRGGWKHEGMPWKQR